MRLVKDVMQHPSYARDTDSLHAAASVMNGSHVEFLPVVDGNSEVVGSITSKDLAEWNAQRLEATQVADVMKKQPCSVNTNDDEAAALSLMRNNQSSHLAVVDEKNHLKGIVSFMTLARRIIRFKQELRKESKLLKSSRNFGLPA